MSVPDYSALVRDAALAFGRPLDSHDACGAFNEFAVDLLHKKDPNFGHLKKTGAQTQYKGHAVDATLYKATGQAVDLIIGSKVASPQTPAKPGWGVDIPRYGADDWISPVALPPGDEEPDTPEKPEQPENPAPKPPDPGYGLPGRDYPVSTSLGVELGVMFMDGYGLPSLHGSLVPGFGEIVASMVYRYQFLGESRSTLIKEAYQRGIEARG